MIYVDGSECDVIALAALRGERVYFDQRGLPYRYDGSMFMDPQGLKVIAPPEVLQAAARDKASREAERRKP